MDPFVAEIRIFPFNFAPKGWAFCDGQLLPINQNQALFSLLGTMYGGNGQTTFALPNLQGRMPVHIGQGITQGQSAGEQAHTLVISELPAHVHVPVGNSGAATSPNLTNNLWANGNQPAYSATANAAMNPLGILAVGGSQPHDNMSPYLVLNFVIALTGIFPSRN